MRSAGEINWTYFGARETIEAPAKRLTLGEKQRVAEPLACDKGQHAGQRFRLEVAESDSVNAAQCLRRPVIEFGELHGQRAIYTR